ncbi:MAG: hypothetical protein HY721_09335 [Planctomycetes bacterium]|nr:hypothetical protein [Planctomycetota bacterium]
MTDPMDSPLDAPLDSPGNAFREDEPLCGGLEGLPHGALAGPEPSPGFQEALLRRTSGAVRRRGALRRARLMACILLAYGAGLATALALRSAGEPAGGPRGPAAAAPQGLAALAPAAPTVEPAETEPAAPSPEELERRARGWPGRQRAALLKVAGDGYLAALGDIERAVRCYREALDLTPRKDLARIEPGESWLFAALKESRL